MQSYLELTSKIRIYWLTLVWTRAPLLSSRTWWAGKVRCLVTFESTTEWIVDQYQTQSKTAKRRGTRVRTRRKNWTHTMKLRIRINSLMKLLAKIFKFWISQQEREEGKTHNSVKMKSYLKQTPNRKHFQSTISSTTRSHLDTTTTRMQQKLHHFITEQAQDCIFRIMIPGSPSTTNWI